MNWDGSFRAMTDAIGALLASGNPVANLDELAPRLKQIRTGDAEDADLRSVREAAVAWVLANPDPLPPLTPS